jgi:hypothetical protein
MGVGGALMVGACFAPILIPGLPELQWNWPLPGTVELGAILIALPGAALVALLAPLVSYRRRDALTMIFFPPVGVRFAWIIGTRLAQLPHRNWPARGDAIPLQGRHYAWIALAANRYALWRQSRAERGPSVGSTPTGDTTSPAARVITGVAGPSCCKPG